MITLIPEINLWTYRWFSLIWNIVINAVVSCAIRFAFHALSQLTLEFVTKHLTTVNLKTNLESLLSGLEKKLLFPWKLAIFAQVVVFLCTKTQNFPQNTNISLERTSQISNFFPLCLPHIFLHVGHHGFCCLWWWDYCWSESGYQLMHCYGCHYFL